jgi:hypothetical protein
MVPAWHALQIEEHLKKTKMAPAWHALQVEVHLSHKVQQAQFSLQDMLSVFDV